MQSRECPSPTSNWDHPFLLAKSFGTPNLVVVHTSKVARVRSASKEAFFLTFPITRNLSNKKYFFLPLTNIKYMKRIGHDYLYLYKAYLFDFIVHSKALKKGQIKRGRLKSKKRILALYSALL